MVVNFRSYINREIFCCFFAEQASLANTRVYNYKNEIKMALRCLSTSGVSGTKKMHILRTEFALISILPRKGKRIVRFREEVYSWRDVKTGLDIIEKYSFFWKIGGRRTLPSLPFIVLHLHLSSFSLPSSSKDHVIPRGDRHLQKLAISQLKSQQQYKHLIRYSYMGVSQSQHGNQIKICC